MPNQYPDPIGKGGLWLNTSKAGKKFMAGECTFQYNGHPVTTKIIVFRNEKKDPNTKQPDYNIYVNDAFPAKPKENKKPEPPKQDDEDLPF